MWGDRLQREPFIDHECVGRVAGIEIGQGFVSFVDIMERQRGEGRHPIGHVVGVMILACGAGDCRRLAACCQKIERNVP